MISLNRFQAFSKIDLRRSPALLSAASFDEGMQEKNISLEIHPISDSGQPHLCESAARFKVSQFCKAILKADWEG